MRRYSLTSMLGEFMALQRPDLRKSNVDLRDISSTESIQDAKKQGRNRHRYASTGDITTVSSNPDGEPVNVVMRLKSTKRPEKQRPSSLIERIRRKISASKSHSIDECGEEDEIEEVKPMKREPSVRSERIQIHITPVDNQPIRILQVTN